MFLLILCDWYLWLHLYDFTFQYVSINTRRDQRNSFRQSPLHSNMFLLIPDRISRLCCLAATFTFQYVSINTALDWSVPPLYLPLHSNMFLLIQRSRPDSISGEITLHSNMFLLILQSPQCQRLLLSFTFQYVSINTQEHHQEIHQENSFTFQYVSINTSSSALSFDYLWSLHSNMFLLILFAGFRLLPFFLSLHSNMFLLIRSLFLRRYRVGLALHSNMFLLIRKSSIWAYNRLSTLHSNMFLLIPAWMKFSVIRKLLYIPICFY